MNSELCAADNTLVTIACDKGVVDHTTRQGLGLAKHVHTRHLWLQAAKDEGPLDMVKIRSERHPAVLLTKLLPFNRIQELCKLVGIEYDQDSKTLKSSVSQHEVHQNLSDACRLARVSFASMSSCRGHAT